MKLTQQAVKIRADIDVSCYTYEGIDAVKNALRAGIACSTDVVPIKINLIAPPLYVMTTSTPEKAVNILQFMGNFVVKVLVIPPPKKQRLFPNLKVLICFTIYYSIGGSRNLRKSM